MRVTYFSKSSDVGPSSRYRIHQYLPYLAAAGIDCAVRPLWTPTYFALLNIAYAPVRNLLRAAYAVIRFLRRGLDLCLMGKPDLVVVEGQLFPYCPAWVEQVLAWMGRKLVVEFDDAIYLTRCHQQKMPRLLRRASAAIVGNRTLAAYAHQYASTVQVVPTVVDTTRFAPRQRSAEKAKGDKTRSPTIVWIGLAYNFSYLEVLIPALRRVRQECGAVFRVISSRPPSLPGVEVEFMPWDLSTEVAHLQDCDIGVMPLPDTEWARGKCGLKLLQYLAVGLPAVASPVGVNREIITSGVNGLLAMTSDEWSDHLSRLCREAELRERFGRAGRRTVEEQYALTLWGPRLAQTYLTLAGRPGTHIIGQPDTSLQRRCA